MRNRTNLGAVQHTASFASVQEMLRTDNITNGRMVISYNHHHLDLELSGAPADTLVVVFHGALPRAAQWPLFSGSDLLDDLENSGRLSIADPSIGMHETLALSWYAGNQQMPDLQRTLPRIVDKIAIMSKAKQVVFFGASGGGFAALQMSRHFPGSLALVVNPQTSISNYLPSPVRGYLRRCWGAGSLDVTQIEHDLTKSYAEGHDNTIAYIQNSRDKAHVDNHLRPFLEALPDTHRVWLLTDAWGSASGASHIPPPKRVIKEAIVHLTTCDADWTAGLQRAGFISSRNGPA